MKQKTNNQDLTIVIITKDRAAVLRETLDKLTALSGNFPIIVVDNGSTDETCSQITRTYPMVRVIPLPQNVGPVARNIGIAYAKTPYVAFADDDSWWEEGALEKAIAYFHQHQRLGLLQAKIIVKGKYVDPTCQAMAWSPLPLAKGIRKPSLLGFVACGAIVRKQAFEAVGGFNTHLTIGGEETLLAIDMAAAGWQLVYCDDIVAHHYPSQLRNYTRNKRTETRNYFVSMFLRRPLGSIISTVYAVSRKTFPNRHIIAGLFAAIKELPWISRHRKVISWSLDQSLNKLQYFP